MLHSQGSILDSGLPGSFSPLVTSSDVPSVAVCRGYGRAMVRTMTAAGSVPHFHFHDDVNMTKLVQLRRELQLYPKAGKVTMLPFIIKVQDNPAQFPHSSPSQRAVCCCQTPL